jgi:hypothetical protein
MKDSIAPTNCLSKTRSLELLENYALDRVSEIATSDGDPSSRPGNNSNAPGNEEIISHLSLQELESLFDRELGDSDRLQAEADCLSRRSVESLFRAGRLLSAIRDILKPARQWTKWQKEHKVSVTSAWQAIALFEVAVSVDAVAGLTRSEALTKFDITKPKPDPVTNGVTTKKIDQESARRDGLSVYGGESQDAEKNDTNDTGVDQFRLSEEPEAAPDDNGARQTEPPAPTIPPLEYLHKINVKLEELERGLAGVPREDHFIRLIDKAIATLQRLRGNVATGIDAA